MTIKNSNSDLLFPIENWKDTWPFVEMWVTTIFFQMCSRYRKKIPEYDSFLEMIVDLDNLGYNKDGLQLSYKEVIESYPELINENLSQQGYNECFLENGKLYCITYPSPIDQQLNKYSKMQPFRIDHLNYITILVLAIKVEIKENIENYNMIFNSKNILFFFSNKKTSSQLKNFIKNLAGLHKNILKQAFIEKLKNSFSNSTDNSILISDIIPDKECLQKILFCLDLNTEIVLELSNNCTKCIEVIEYLKNIDTD